MKNKEIYRITVQYKNAPDLEIYDYDMAKLKDAEEILDVLLNLKRIFGKLGELFK